MGNEQSNESKKKWKVYRVTGREVRSDYIRIYLDDYVTYRDGNYKRIDFEKGFFYKFTQLYQWVDERTCVAIDLEKTCYESSMHNFVFSDAGGVMKIVNEVTGGTSETAELLGDIGEMLETRQNMRAYMETSRYANNHGWTKQTSWDMPPNWK